MTNHDLLELLYEAIHTDNPYGVLVREESGEVLVLRTRLYAVRKDYPDLQCLSLVVSPTDPKHELYIIRKSDDGDHGTDNEALS